MQLWEQLLLLPKKIGIPTNEQRGKVTGCQEDLVKRLQGQFNEKRESRLWEKTLFFTKCEHTGRLQVELWDVDERIL